MYRSGFLLGISLFAVLGCGSNQQVASVRGKVTCQGKSVANAFIRFDPIMEKADKRGKSAEGRTDADGHYILGTYGASDGAVLGKHRVMVIYEDAYKRPPCDAPENLVVEVKPGSNDIPIDLTEKAKNP